jgi:hypothetical protein
MAFLERFLGRKNNQKYDFMPRLIKLDLNVSNSFLMNF